MRKRGIVIQTLILAALGIAVFVIMFAVFTGRLRGLGQLDECTAPSRCIGEWSESGDLTDGVTSATDDICNPEFETSLGTTYKKEGQLASIDVEDIVRCTRCCLRT